MNNFLKKMMRTFRKFKKYKKNKCSFNPIIYKDRIPDNSTIKERDFIEVVFDNKPYWAIFKCPCGCDTVISLPLQETHNHYWKLIKSKKGKPTLYPSVWQNKGCLSHFILIKGKVEWCNNTGIEPWVAEPTLYNYPEN